MLNVMNICLRCAVVFSLLFLAMTVDADNLTMVDKKATRETRALYSWLWQIEKSGFLFGHHDDLLYGRYWYNADLKSDTKDVCGDYPGVYSMDFAEIMDDRASSSTNWKEMLRRSIIEARRRGEVIMGCFHLNNPLTGGDSWDNSNNDVAAQILTTNSVTQLKFNSWLDRLVGFVNSLRDDNGNLIPIILRPFHEQTQDWSWWGKKCTTETEFVNLWQYTVKYLRDKKGCHQFIYIISPQSDGNNDAVERFINFRWPGDDYVDMIGYDYYWGENPSIFTNGLINLTKASRQKNKPCAVTETGVEAFTNSKFWTEQILYPYLNGDIKVSFISMWRNKYVSSESDTHYFSVYPGHSSISDFKNFFSDSRTYFSSDLPDMYSMAPDVSIDGHTVQTDANDAEEDGVELEDWLTDVDGIDEPEDFDNSFFSGVENNNVGICLPSGEYYSLADKSDVYINGSVKVEFPQWIKNSSTRIEFVEKGASASEGNRYHFPELSDGDVIRVVVGKNGWTSQAAVLQDNDAKTSLVNGSDWFFIGGWHYYDIAVNASVLQKLQTNGLCLSGLNHKILGVYVMKGTGQTSSDTAPYQSTTSLCASPITLSNWNGTNVSLPTVHKGDVLILKVTAGLAGQMQSYVSKDGTTTFFIGKDTGWNGIGVNEGTSDVIYTIDSDFDADMLNSVGNMTIGGQNITVNAIMITSKFGRTVTKNYTAGEIISTGDFSINAHLGWKKGKWYGIVLPYDVKGEDALKRLFGIDNNLNIDDALCIDTISSLSRITDSQFSVKLGRIKKYENAMRANTPYVIMLKKQQNDVLAYPTETFDLNYSFTGITAKNREALPRNRYIGADGGNVRIALRGVETEATRLNSDGDYFFSDGNLHRSANNGTKVLGGRAYLHLENKNGSNAKINLFVDQTTEINNVVKMQHSVDGEHGFNLNGQKVSKEFKGIVIYKGKKVVKG